MLRPFRLPWVLPFAMAVGCGSAALPPGGASDGAPIADGAGGGGSSSAAPTNATAAPANAPPKAECAAFMDVVGRTTTLRSSIHREPPTAAKAQEWAKQTAALSDEAKALPLSQSDLVVEAANLATRMGDLARDLKTLAAAETAGNPTKAAAAHKRVINTSEQVEVITREPAARCGGDTKLLLPVTGQMRTADIQSVVRTRFPAFQACYEAGLKRNPKLRGLVNVRFVIGMDGTVTSAARFEEASIPVDVVAPPSTSTEPPMPDAAVASCVVNAFLPLQFVKPEGGLVTVIYPVSLAPAP